MSWIQRIRNPGLALYPFFSSQRRIAFSLVFLAVVFNAVCLWPEAAYPTPQTNDEVFHQLAAQQAGAALKEGLNPTDYWLSRTELGLPLFHQYQHLPQVLLAVVDQVSGRFFPISRLFDFSRYLLLVLFPLSIFRAMRRFGFNYLAAGLAALVSSLLSTNGLFGFEYVNYIWRGWGLYTQLWAMFFLPLALAEIYQFLRGNGSLFWAVLLAVIVLICHVYYGYIMLLSAFLFILLELKGGEILSRFKRFVAVFLLAGIVTSYFYLSVVIDAQYIYRSQFIPPEYFDSLGAGKVLTYLFTGQLFDYGRFPSITILFFLSLILLFLQGFYRKENYLLLVSLTALWLVLFFGRATWGFILNLLPFSYHVQFERFIGGFHLAAIMLTGAGIALLWEKFWPKPRRHVCFLIALLALLIPVYWGQAVLYQENSTWRMENQRAFAENQKELAQIEAVIKSLPPGRVYAGLANNWGNYPYYKIGFVPLYNVLAQMGIDSFGYSYFAGTLSSDIRLQFDDSRLTQYNLFDIRYVLLHKTWTAPAFYTKTREFGNYILYQAPTTGYFDLVDAPAVFYGNVKDFYAPNYKWLLSFLPELKQHPILDIGKESPKISGLPTFSFQGVSEQVLSLLAPVQDSADRGEILQEGIELNQYWARFSVSRDCYLMLKTNYSPGWHVYLDSKEVSPVMLTPGFIGIKVQPGAHHAAFVYKAPAWRCPLMVVGILVLAGLAVISRKRFAVIHSWINKRLFKFRSGGSSQELAGNE